MSEQPPKPLTSTQRWLSRLSFTFLILAGLLVWDSYRAMVGLQYRPTWRIWAQFVVAIFCFIFSAAGTSVRHRDHPPDQPS